MERVRLPGFWYAFPILFLVSLPVTHSISLRLITLAVSAGLAFWIWRRDPESATFPLKLPLALWLLAALASVPGAVDPWYSLREVKTEAGYGIVAFFTFFLLARDRQVWRWLLMGLAAGFIVLAGIAIAIVVVQHGGIWVDNRGPMGGVGTYSTWLVTILPFLGWFLYREAGTGWKRHLRWLIPLLFLTSGYLSKNRMFWIVLVVQIGFLMFLFRRYSERSLRRILLRWGGATLLVIVIVGLIAAMNRGGAHWESLSFDPRDDVRIGFWSETAETIADNPLVGAGFGRRSFTKAYPHLTPEGWPLWHAHNLFLDYGIQMGIPGIAALLFLFLALGNRYRTLLASPSEEVRLLGMCGLILLVGVVLKSQTDDFFIRHLSLEFWALSGMLLGRVAGLQEAER